MQGLLLRLTRCCPQRSGTHGGRPNRPRGHVSSLKETARIREHLSAHLAWRYCLVMSDVRKDRQPDMGRILNWNEDPAKAWRSYRVSRIRWPFIYISLYMMNIYFVLYFNVACQSSSQPFDYCRACTITFQCTRNTVAVIREHKTLSSFWFPLSNASWRPQFIYRFKLMCSKISLKYFI